MHLVQILLPIADNQGQPFGKEAFENLKAQLADTFDGVTAFSRSPGEGLWSQGQDGKTADEVVIFEVMVDELERAQWADLRKALERRFRQERVIIRHMQIGLV